MRTKLMLLLSALVLGGAISPSYAQILIDTYSPLNGSGVDFRSAGASLGSALSFARDITIGPGTIGVKVNLETDGNLKFLIFDHSNAALLYSSPPKAFSDDGDTWKTSDPFSFTFLGGHTYDVGAIPDVGGLWDYDRVSDIIHESGITSLLSNPNFSNFNSPIIVSHGSADGAVQLSAVPEPGIATLLILAVAGLAFRAHHRSNASLPH
jgi:hypothetical protein